MEASLPVVAGAISTTIFVASTLPMLVKAARTKDLGSYSLGNILLSNLGNVISLSAPMPSGAIPSIFSTCRSGRSGRCTPSTWSPRR
jgi:hypothetical protein